MTLAMGPDMYRRTFTFLAASSALFACGRSEPECTGPTKCIYDSDNSVLVEPSDEQRRCNADSECVAVRSGDVCQGSSCANDSIARSASDAYAASFSDGRARCNDFDVTLAFPETCYAQARCNQASHRCELVE